MKPSKMREFWKEVRGFQFILMLHAFWKDVRRVGFNPANTTMDYHTDGRMAVKLLKREGDQRGRLAKELDAMIKKTNGN